ncbi:hypothetical protein [Nocardia grenadensis]|uniref:hypothetical protein n=1 Tax=Nocardia grenadensis TaxID=931537 RepID=UPI003D90A939
MLYITGAERAFARYGVDVWFRAVARRILVADGLVCRRGRSSPLSTGNPVAR